MSQNPGLATAGAYEEQRPEASPTQVRATHGLIVDASRYLSAAAVLVMLIITSYEVCSRYVFNSPTYWVTEVSTYILVATAFLPLALVQASGSQIRVEIFLDMLGRRKRDFVESLIRSVSLFFVAIFAWQAALLARSDYINNTFSWGLVRIPQWIPESALSVGLVALLIVILKEMSECRRSRHANIYGIVGSIWIATPITLSLLEWQNLQNVSSAGVDLGTLVVVAATVLTATLTAGWRVAAAFAVILIAVAALFGIAHGATSAATGTLILLAVLFFIFMGAPIGFALGIAGAFCIYFLLPNSQPVIIAERAWASVNSFTFTAVPMFVLMGSLLTRSGVSSEFYGALATWLGRIRGGLAYATVGGSGIFAAVCGSSIATAATIGKVACPEMLSRGYGQRITAGTIAAGGTLGILIPPSVPLIIFGATVGAPVTALFIAGIIPGILVMLSMAAWIYVAGIFTTEIPPAGGEKPTWEARLRTLIDVGPFLGLIGVIFGGLYLGVVTATEAGAAGALFALALCMFRGRMTLRMLLDALVETTVVTSSILIIVVGAAILTYGVDYLGIPKALIFSVESLDLSPPMLLIGVCVLYFILGMFIDPVSLILMTVSITYPIVVLAGYDAIWFGIALVMMVEIGLITPPVGLNLFVIKGIAPDMRMNEVVMGSLPFVLVLLANVIMIAVFPDIVTWLPSKLLN